MSPVRYPRSTGLVLLLPFLTLAVAGQASAQGTIIVGKDAIAVIQQSGQSTASTAGVLVVAPGAICVQQQIQPAAQATPKAQPKAGTPVAAMALTRKEYKEKLRPDAKAMKWVAGTLADFPASLDLGDGVSVSRVVAIVFDDDETNATATVTYASGDGKKLTTRAWVPKNPKFKFNVTDDTTTYSYQATPAQLKALFLIVPPIAPQQPATTTEAGGDGPAVMALTQMEYNEKKKPDPNDPTAGAMNWIAGTLTGYSDPFDLGGGKIVAIAFDDDKNTPAAVTFASADGKKLYTKLWGDAKGATFKFKEKGNIPIAANQLKAIFFIVPPLPPQKPAQ